MTSPDQSLKKNPVASYTISSFSTDFQTPVAPRRPEDISIGKTGGKVINDGPLSERESNAAGFIKGDIVTDVFKNILKTNVPEDSLTSNGGKFEDRFYKTTYKVKGQNVEITVSIPVENLKITGTKVKYADWTIKDGTYTGEAYVNIKKGENDQNPQNITYNWKRTNDKIELAKK